MKITKYIHFKKTNKNSKNDFSFFHIFSFFVFFCVFLVLCYVHKGFFEEEGGGGKSYLHLNCFWWTKGCVTAKGLIFFTFMNFLLQGWPKRIFHLLFLPFSHSIFTQGYEEEAKWKSFRVCLCLYLCAITLMLCLVAVDDFAILKLQWIIIYFIPWVQTNGCKCG